MIFRAFSCFFVVKNASLSQVGYHAIPPFIDATG
jgi:hypothetical protein